MPRRWPRKFATRSTWSLPSNNFVVKAGLGSLGNLLTAPRVNLFGALDVNPGPLGIGRDHRAHAGAAGGLARLGQLPPARRSGAAEHSQINTSDTFTVNGTINGVATFEFTRNTPSNSFLPDGQYSGLHQRLHERGASLSVDFRQLQRGQGVAWPHFLPGVTAVIAGSGVQFVVSSAFEQLYVQPLTVTQSAEHTVGLHTAFNNYGDTTPVAYQGETVIQDNRISNTLQTGISVLPVVGKDALGNSTIGVPGRTRGRHQFADVEHGAARPGRVHQEQLDCRRRPGGDRFQWFSTNGRRNRARRSFWTNRQ